MSGWPGSQDAGSVVLTAVSAILDRKRVVAMGTGKGGDAHDESLSGRFGQSPRNRSGTFPQWQVTRNTPQECAVLLIFLLPKSWKYRISHKLVEMHARL